MKRTILISIICGLCSFNVFAHSDHDAQSKDTAKAFIISPKDGDKVPQTFTVKFGLMGMSVSPAGQPKESSGHHHLLVDGKQLPDLTKPLGTEVTHFGGGQTETILTLEPGVHTLQLILGDFMHKPHNPPVVSRKITITVE